MKHITESYNRWRHSVADKMRLSKHPLLRDLLAELIGTTVYIAFASGIAAQAHLTEGSIGRIMEVSTGYATGWALGLFVAGKWSPGMCNPCVAFANALVGRLDFLTMLAFWLVHLIGAILGTLLVMAIYWEKLWDYTDKYDGGTLNMSSTGVIFSSSANDSIGSLCGGQVITGMFTLICIMAILDKNNRDFSYFYVILYTAVTEFLLLNDFSYQTTSSINPALDLGGRMALAMIGYGSSPFTFANHCFWVFLIMPFVGTICGVLVYELVVGIHLPRAKEEEEENEPHIESPWENQS